MDTRDATTDRIALNRLFEATVGGSWKNKAGWGTSRPLREWFGVTVGDGGRVTSLELHDNNLSGGCANTWIDYPMLQPASKPALVQARESLRTDCAHSYRLQFSDISQKDRRDKNHRQTYQHCCVSLQHYFELAALPH